MCLYLVGVLFCFFLSTAPTPAVRAKRTFLPWSETISKWTQTVKLAAVEAEGTENRHFLQHLVRYRLRGAMSWSKVSPDFLLWTHHVQLLNFNSVRNLLMKSVNWDQNQSEIFWLIWDHLSGFHLAHTDTTWQSMSSVHRWRTFSGIGFKAWNSLYDETI